MSSKNRQKCWMLDAIDALRFEDADGTGLRALAETNWFSLLSDADRAHITLPLAVRCRSLFPAAAQQRLDDALARNALCHENTVSACGEIADAFTRKGIDFLVLKGLAQWPWYVDDSRHRTQSDIDIYSPPESLDAARDVLKELKYEPVHTDRSQPVDHLPVMIRKTGWAWRGDYYDPSRPPSVELHFRFWDDKTEGFPAGDPQTFWSRRVTREIGGIHIPTLNAVDGLKYSAMHLIRHLLRGDLQVRHVYELAHFLERSTGDEEFWARWQLSQSSQQGLVEAIGFRLASDWFRCRLHPAPRRLVEQLPAPVDRWFRLFGLSPASSVTQPNKDELWLHLCLIRNPDVRRQIAIKRLFPMRRQRVILNPHVPADRSAVLSLRRVVYEARFLAARALHHCSALLPVLRSALRWWKAGLAAT
jgi:hypothetical protein